MKMKLGKPISIPVIQMALLGMMPSFLKVAYYRLKGAKIGKRVKIGLFSIILAEDIEIGDDTKISPLSFIKCRKLTIGNRTRIASVVAIDTGLVRIGHDVVIMEQVVIGGMQTPRSKIELGNRVKIFPYSFLNPTEPIILEEDAGVGGANYLFTHGSWQSELDGFPIAFGPITIRKGVWLPWRVFIMPNVEIGEYCTISAGSIVNKNIPPRSLAVGSPAKVISADGAYIKHRTIEQKNDIMVRIIRDLADLLKYERYDISIEEDSCFINLTIKQNNQMWIIHYTSVEKPIENISANTLLVTLNQLSNEVRLNLNSNMVTWFDLANKQCSIGRNPLFSTVRNYLSRYGIRFAIDGEKDI